MLKAVDLSITRGTLPVVAGLNWQVSAGEVWGVLGANGAGKSSLLLCLAGLLTPSAGAVYLMGRPLGQFARRQLAGSLGFLAQDQAADLPIRLSDWLLLSRYPHQGPWGRAQPQDSTRVEEVLAQTELTALADRWTSELSGGERQRMALAGLLVQAAPWMILDEPTNHLDVHHQMTLLPRLIAASSGSGGALVMSLHDVNLVEQFCSHCLVFIDGAEPLAGPVGQVLTAQSASLMYRHPIEVVQGPHGRIFIPSREGHAPATEAQG